VNNPKRFYENYNKANRLPKASMDTLHPQETTGEYRSAKRQCQNCGHYVTKQFVRVFGANDGSLYGCLSCLTLRDLREGGGKQP
jgi:ribosomal protein L32